ncbi:MAG: hypothetical protein KDC53_21835, partial [Saprospiraceae bacterium]|nr:hypothetical protein [Saprospiraceae bacterium]
MRNLFCFATIIFILLGCSEEQQHRAKSNAIVAEGFLQQKVTELSGRNSIIDNRVFETRDDLPTDE